MVLHTRRTVCFFIVQKLRKHQKKHQITCKKACFWVQGAMFVQYFFLGFHFVVYQLATWSIRREQILPKASVSRLSWPPSFGAKFALLGSHTWPNKIYLTSERGILSYKAPQSFNHLGRARLNSKCCTILIPFCYLKSGRFCYIPRLRRVDFVFSPWGDLRPEKALAFFGFLARGQLKRAQLLSPGRDAHIVLRGKGEGKSCEFSQATDSEQPK